VNDEITDESKDDGPETQWTEAARTRYQAASRAMLEVLTAHVELMAARQGRQAELSGYFASTDAVERALHAFGEAEFDLCGSFPFALVGRFDDDPEDDTDGDSEHAEPGPLLTVVHRMELEVRDEPALLAAGRAAYALAWPDDTTEDARLAVGTAAAAVGELIHVHGLAGLSAETAFLTERFSEMSIVQPDHEPSEPV
jgi:hypothetical protein